MTSIGVRFCWVLLVIVSVVMPGGLFSQSLPKDESEAQVARAIRASLLGDAEAVGVVARLRAREEDRLREARIPHEKLAENIEVLALATRRPVATLAEKSERLEDLPADAQTKNLDRLLRRISPRQHFIEARKDRRYAGVRRLWNSLATPIAAAFQAQFFPLISLPFEFVDYLVVGRTFLTPEQRKELYLSRAVVAEGTRGSTLEAAMETIDRWTPRRTAGAALQAKLNGDRATERNLPARAEFWYRREMQLLQRTEPFRQQHVDAIAEANRERLARERAFSVVDGDRLLGSSREFAEYSDLLRAFLLDPVGPRFGELARDYKVSYPRSTAVDDLLAAEAAAAIAGRDQVLAQVRLERLRREQPGTPWDARAGKLLARPTFAPEAAFREAQAIIDRRFRRFLFEARPAEVRLRSLRSEEARLSRSLWIGRASGLFLTDVLARAMILPFLDPFPKDELLDAAAVVPAGFFETPEGRTWLARTAKAQRVARRYTDSAATWKRLGETSRAEAMLERAARELEREGDRAASPSDAADAYRRLINAWPGYPKREAVEEKLAEAEMKESAITVITRAELEAYPELWFQSGLRLSPALFDKDPSNGEMAKEGVLLLDRGAASYVDEAGDNRVEVPLPARGTEEVLRLLEPRRRSRALATELQKPLPRRRIPLAIEGGALPSFSVAPTLVPLDPDIRDRRLYF